MSTLTPMEQLLAFCDWQRKHEPPPAGQKHIAEWAAEEIERLLAKNETLRAFARDVMAAGPDGDVDGGALQEIAVTHGLLVPETRTEPCGDECACAEYYTRAEMADGVTCYRRAPLLRPQGTADEAGPAEGEND